MLKNQRIHIIHMNDLHSHFENMAKIASYIKKVKQDAVKKSDNVVVVDLGDHMDRIRIETEGTNGKVNIEILNELSIDIAALGNNEGLTFTKEILDEIYKNKKFKILACNLKDLTTNKLPEWLDEYWIQDLGGFKIGWIGATVAYETFYKLQGWKVEKSIAPIQKIIQKMKSKVDLIILLSHLGIKEDEKIAASIPDIDVIIGGHTHRFIEKGLKKENQALICQVGIFGEYIGHLTIDYNAKTRVIKDIEEKTISVANYNNDPTILQVIEKNRLLAKKELGIPVTFLTQPLAVSLETESPLGNLLADGVRRWVEADLGFINTGQLLEGLGEGIVTKERLHKICPSPINVCKVKLSGKQIRTTLEQSLLDEFKHYSLKGFGFRGKELGTLAVSGISVEFDLLALPYQKIGKILLGDDLLEDEKEYIVGTLDMFTFGGGYFLIRDGREIEYFLPEFIRDILAVQLLDQDSIKQSFQTRWIKMNGKDRD